MSKLYKSPKLPLPVCFRSDWCFLSYFDMNPTRGKTLLTSVNQIFIVISG